MACLYSLAKTHTICLRWFEWFEPSLFESFFFSPARLQAPAPAQVRSKITLALDTALCKDRTMASLNLGDARYQYVPPPCCAMYWCNSAVTASDIYWWNRLDAFNDRDTAISPAILCAATTNDDSDQRWITISPRKKKTLRAIAELLDFSAYSASIAGVAWDKIIRTKSVQKDIF